MLSCAVQLQLSAVLCCDGFALRSWIVLCCVGLVVLGVLCGVWVCCVHAKGCRCPWGGGVGLGVVWRLSSDEARWYVLQLG